MSTTSSRARARALRASLAVTLGGALVAGCGTSQTDDDRTTDGGTVDAATDATSDTATDTAPDTAADVAPDTAPDVSPDTPPADAGATCADESDGVCPEGCSIDEDYDCCMEFDPDWCTYDPEWGCGCAVEGPFAPPEAPR